jgi:hypothetical protein
MPPLTFPQLQSPDEHIFTAKNSSCTLASLASFRSRGPHEKDPSNPEKQARSDRDEKYDKIVTNPRLTKPAMRSPPVRHVPRAADGRTATRSIRV